MFFRKYKRISGTKKPKILFWSLFLVLFFCLFAYGYLVHEAIANIVKRQTLEAELATLGSKVISLEGEYIKAKNNVTLESAQALGFVSASTKKFVTSNSKAVGVSLVANDL